MKHHVYYSSKGGSGCSTVAATVAAMLARSSKVLLIDASRQRDLHLVLGLERYDITSLRPVSDSLTYANLHPAQVWGDDFYDHLVIDYGTTTPTLYGHVDSSTLVTRLGFLHVYSAFTRLHTTHVVVVEEPDCALTTSDLARAIGFAEHDMITVPFDPAVARAVDAGLLVSCVPSSLSAPFTYHIKAMTQ